MKCANKPSVISKSIYPTINFKPNSYDNGDKISNVIHTSNETLSFNKIIFLIYIANVF